MTVECGGRVFGYSDDALSLENYAGITGCEGRNRFYDFTVETGLAAHDNAADGEH
jgi:guanyl-specific ribonuclease Sa